MSDTQQGPGWWLASDGRWYPPQHEAEDWSSVRPTSWSASAKLGIIAAIMLAGGAGLLLEGLARTERAGSLIDFCTSGSTLMCVQPDPGASLKLAGWILLGVGFVAALIAFVVKPRSPSA